MPKKNSNHSLHALLKKQLHECLPGIETNSPALQHFLQQVSATYKSFAQNQKQEERYRNIIEHSAHIIYKVNKNGCFVFVNPAAERITGYSQAELLGRHFTELIKPGHRSAAVEFYSGQLAHKQNSTYYEFPIITKQGAELWVGQSVQLAGEGNGQAELTALVIDITAHKIYEQQTVRQKEKYLNIITNMNLGMVEVDLDERIQFANHTFSLISGYSQQELLGQKASELLVPAAHRQVLKSKMALRERGQSDMYEIQVQDKQGRLRWWMVSGAPNYDARGNIIGSIGIHLDITDKKTMELELEQSRQKTEQSSRAKAAFLAHMSHEIRTPLNGIIGMIRELGYGPLSKKQQEYVDNASVASGHLLSVLNNVLDISKIEAGELSLESRHFKLKETIKEVKDIMKLKARKKGLYFGLDLLDIHNVAYVGDPARIRQVLLNLIGNAIKFTDKGGVYVECKIRLRQPHSHTVALVVEDTGIGVDDAFKEKLFKQFAQEDASVSRKYGGTGLGMAISHEIVKLMGGSITVASKKNEGTRIELLFELPLGQAQKIDGDALQARGAMAAKSRVLLVEDNGFNRAVACNTLQRHACEVTEALNGEQAIALLKINRFDVILMDLQMPVMDGFEATRIIRQQLRLSIPIIALTAHAFKSELEQCLAVGMNDYITKPFEEKRLVGLVKQLAVNESLPHKKKQAVKNNGGKLYSLAGLKELGQGDDGFVQKMIRLFIEQSLPAVQQMQAACSSGNLATVYALAHRLKPSLDSLHIKTLYTPIRELEQTARSGVNSPLLHEQVQLLATTLVSVVEQLQQELP